MSSKERGNRPIPTEVWDKYGAPWPSGPARALLRIITGAETPYETFLNLGVYEESWKTTKELLPRIPEGKVLDLGCGPGITFEETLEITGAGYLLGVDISSKMLAEAQRRSEEIMKKRKGTNIELMKMDIGSSWLLKDKYDVILSHITSCWITPADRANVFAETPKYLNENGVAVFSLRTNVWSQERLKQHIPEELRRSFRACVGAIVGAKKYTDQVEAMLAAGEIGATRPTEEEIYSLVKTNGLKIVETRGTFWPDDRGGRAGLALLLERKLA